MRDPAYLSGKQYASGGNLNARIGFHDRFSVNPVPWHRWMFDQLLVPPVVDARVLEAGCGVGRLWADNIDRVPGGWRVTLTDLSPGILQEAVLAATALNERVNGVAADVQALPFHDTSFDLVIANHMLYHVPDREVAIRELRRVLSPTGVLYTATFGPPHLQEIGELIRRHSPDADPYPHGLEHFGLHNGAEQLTRAFSEVTIVRYPDEAVATDADGLVEFIASSADAYGVSADALESIRAEVANTIRLRGAFVVSKDTGVFISHP